MTKAETLADRKSETILFVDDEPLSLKYFKSSVGKYANVVTASSPEAAMEILAKSGNDISVVVSDERMPRDSGVSFLSEVRKSWPSTIRVLTSAYADTENLQQAINAAAIYRFVPKPWDLDELCAAMEDALHAERSAAALAEPVIGPSAGGDAESANLALLAILANGLDAPLKSLDKEAGLLAEFSQPGALDPSPSVATSFLGAWASRLRLGKIAASAAQIRRDVEHCRSLANSIGNLARSLADPAVTPTSSMADTICEVTEQALVPASGDALVQPPAGQDFPYAMPREIMKFVLTNLLRGGTRPSASNPGTFPSIELVSAAGHNEVRITSATSDRGAPALENNETWRTVRCALWAFGGELLSSTDKALGKSTLTMCLPKA